VQVIELPGLDICPTSLGFSPDGRLLAAWDSLGASVLDLVSSRATSLWRTTRPQFSYGSDRAPAIGFTADSRGVIALHLTYRVGTNPEAALRVYNATTGDVIRGRPASPWTSLEIGPGGRLVYLSVYDDDTGKIGILRWNPLTGQVLPVFGWSRRDLFHLAVSADERCVVASIWEGARVLKFTGKEPPKRASKQLAYTAYNFPFVLTVSADGAHVAATGFRYAPAGWHVEAWAVGTGKRYTVAKGAGRYLCGRNVHFHPTKPLLAYCTSDDEVIFWNAATRTEVKRFAWGIDRLEAVRFSPDGLRCAAAGAGKVVVWDVDA
jgi:WD40 repeat protein